MTVEQFITKIEKYYGKYSDTVRDYVIGFITESYGEKKLDRIFEYLILTESAKYKAVPDIATIREAGEKSRRKFYGDANMIGTDLENEYMSDPLADLRKQRMNPNQIEDQTEK